ncbi:hypothetical protein ACWKT7_27940 [Bacillus toyonensis]
MGKKKKDKQPVVGICALCKKESELEESHIISKFAYKGLKKETFTGRIRTPDEPNIPLQDGTKKYLLCGVCEDLFNEYETPFSKKIYYPFKENKLDQPISYDGDWLYRFITSVHWRVLYHSLEAYRAEQNPERKLPQENLSVLSAAEEIMRSYLLSSREDLDKLENHIVFLTEEMLAPLVSNPHVTIFGSVFSKTIVQDHFDSIHIVTNLSGILMVTIIKKHSGENWVNTIVKNQTDTIAFPQGFDSPVGLVIRGIEADRQRYIQGLSPNQLKNMKDRINKNIEGFKKSGSYQRSKLDQELKQQKLHF